MLQHLVSMNEAAIDFGLKIRHISIMKINLTAVFQKVPEGYIGFVEELPGANTQGATLEEVRSSLQEAVSLVLETNRVLAEESLKDMNVIREPIPVTAA